MKYFEGILIVVLSVSEDSRVTHWSLVTSTLVFSDIITLNFNKKLECINDEKLKESKFGGG